MGVTTSKRTHIRPPDPQLEDERLERFAAHHIGVGTPWSVPDEGGDWHNTVRIYEESVK